MLVTLYNEVSQSVLDKHNIFFDWQCQTQWADKWQYTPSIKIAKYEISLDIIYKSVKTRNDQWHILTVCFQVS